LRVRYIAKITKAHCISAAQFVQLSIFASFIIAEVQNLVYPLHKKQREIFPFLYFHGCGALFYKGKITPEK